MEKKGRIINIGTRKMDEIVEKMFSEYGSNQYIIFDLRSGEEYNKSHIKYAKNIDGDKLIKLFTDKNIYLVLYCDSGTNSMSYSKKLASKGYTVYNLLNGFDSYRGKYLD